MIEAECSEGYRRGQRSRVARRVANQHTAQNPRIPGLCTVNRDGAAPQLLYSTPTVTMPFSRAPRTTSVRHISDRVMMAELKNILCKSEHEGI